jgi:hypothetical protein
MIESGPPFGTVDMTSDVEQVTALGHEAGLELRTADVDGTDHPA